MSIKFIDQSIISVLNSIECNAIVCDKANLKRITTHLATKCRTFVVKYWGEGDWMVYFDADYGYETLRHKLKGIQFTIDDEDGD